MIQRSETDLRALLLWVLWPFITFLLNMIKLFRLDSMVYTPFSKEEEEANQYFRDRDIKFVDSIAQADLLVARKYPSRRVLFKIKLKYRGSKPILIWTHEPRYNTVFETQTSPTILRPAMHIMNLYTGGVYLTNYHYGRVFKHRVARIENCDRLNSLPNRPVAFLGTYVKNPHKHSLKKKDQELNLTELRQNLAVLGRQRGLVDIYGKRWPEDISRENSRGEGWIDKKLDILADYKLNLCLENTNYPYYCTEKIWHSIISQSLPIYYGKGNKIYEDFPSKSFVDAAEFDTPQDLFDFIESLQDAEYVERLNKCIDVYNEIYNSNVIASSSLARLRNLIERIEQIVG